VQGHPSLNVPLRFFPVVEKHFTWTEMTTVNNFTIRINKKWILELCIVIIKHETQKAFTVISIKCTQHSFKGTVA
jgi:hypothetical protein